MNLHGIVSPYVAAINPLVPLSIFRSIGYTTQDDGRQVPDYAYPVDVYAQVQALSAGDLSQIEGLNIQGEKRAVYINGRSDGVIREDRKGGDLIVFKNKVKASFLGIITDNQLLVTQLIYGNIITGEVVSGDSVNSATMITGYGSGRGAEGSYTVTPQQTSPGPVMQLKTNETWLNSHVLEYWPDWCKFIITRQDGT